MYWAVQRCCRDERNVPAPTMMASVQFHGGKHVAQKVTDTHRIVGALNRSIFDSIVKGLTMPLATRALVLRPVVGAMLRRHDNRDPLITGLVVRELVHAHILLR